MTKKFICIQCDKYYKSYQSIWNHNNKFHKIDKNKIIEVEHTFTNSNNEIKSTFTNSNNKIESTFTNSNNEIESTFTNLNNDIEPIFIQSNILKKNINKLHNCKNCNAVFTTRQAKSRHMLKTCKIQNKLKIENDQIKNKYLELNAKYNELLNIKPTNINIHIHTHNYIYLIEKYDMNINQVLYKIGKSNRPIHMRLKEHGSEAKILLVIDVDNCDTTESNLLTILNNDINILNRKDIGKEYFSCTDINNPRLYIKNLVIKNIN